MNASDAASGDRDVPSMAEQRARARAERVHWWITQCRTSISEARSRRPPDLDDSGESLSGEHPSPAQAGTTPKDGSDHG